MPSRTIEAVLFDYGGVFTASPFSAADDFCAKVGLTREELFTVIFGPYDRDTDHPWHRMERGEMAIEAARDEIRALAREQGAEVDLFEFFMAIGAVSQGPIAPMIECARKLKTDGLRTALVTNNVAEFSAHWRKTLPLDELFDVVVDSSQVGLRKPDPRIFALTLERLGGVEASRAAFLDDFPGNVAAARDLGFHAILVEPDPLPAIDQLLRLLD
jgi:epoxide hydrolase-like predicted phosphatase